MQTKHNRYCTIYLARHGETDWNVEKRIQGHSDIELNANGIAQASDFAKVLKDIHFDAAFSSDLLRAKRTAEIVLQEREIVIATTELLREQTWGDFDGIPVEEYREKLKDHLAELQKLKSDDEKLHYRMHESIETKAESASRALTFIREVSLAYPDNTVLIVCHGVLMRNIMMTLRIGTYDELDYGKVEIGNTAYMKLRCDGIDFFLDEVYKISGLKNIPIKEVTA